MTRASSTHRRPLDVDQAADYLGTTARHVRRLIFERRLPFHKLGSKVRIQPDDLDMFLAATRRERLQ